MELIIQHKLPIYKPLRIEFEENISIHTNLIGPHTAVNLITQCEHAASSQFSEVGRQQQKMEMGQRVLWAAQEEQQNKIFGFLFLVGIVGCLGGLSKNRLPKKIIFTIYRLHYQHSSHRHLFLFLLHNFELVFVCPTVIKLYMLIPFFN